MKVFKVMNKEEQEKIEYTQFQKKPARFMFFVARKYRLYIIVTMVLVFISEILFSGVVVYLGKLTDALSRVSSSDSSAEVYHFAWLLIGAFAISFVFWRISGFLGSYVTTRLEARSFNITFDYLIRHSYAYFSDRLVGKLSSKVSNIARSVEAIFPMFFWDFLRMISKFLIFCVLAFLANVWLGIIFVVFILIFSIFNVTTSRKLANYAKKRADKASELRGNIVDDLTNVMAIKQNVRIDSEIENIAGYVEDHRVWHLKAWRYFETALTFNSMMAILMLVIVVFSSLHLWEAQKIGIGIVVMAILMATRLVGDLVFMGATFNKFMEQYGQLKEGLEEIFIPHKIVDDKEAQKVIIKKGHIVFDDVYFYYEENDKRAVFEKLSVTIPMGQKIGLVGESGEGKSTFVSLLLRFMDVESGKIMIDGYDTKHMRQNDLRGAIAYVPQEALLFHRTLEKNIMYSNVEATRDDVKTASVRAHALEFINSFPQKFDTLVGERGVKLSGGQKQRVMIARAMLKNSPILVLDEATSSLDSHSENLIQEALEELMKERTTIVIAHRLSTLKQMDRIIVFDGGKIVEDGTHEELLEQKGKYFELWQHQAGALQ